MLRADDRSVQVHACHGPARQVDVLREVLLGLLADDPTLEPRDILVMCPDIETYAPLIAAGFGLGDVVARRAPGASAAGAARRPFAAPDQPAARRRRAAARPRRQPGHRQRGARPRAAAPVRRRFGFSDDDLEQLATLGARRPASAGASTRTTATPFGCRLRRRTPGEFGLDRVLAGVAMSDDAHAWLDSHPAARRRRQHRVELAGRLAEYVDRLRGAVDALDRRPTAASTGSTR